MLKSDQTHDPPTIGHHNVACKASASNDPIALLKITTQIVLNRIANEASVTIDKEMSSWNHP